MNEPNQQPPQVGAPPPNWNEAMQGKTNNAKRIQQSKRIFLVLSLTFFGMFTWLYILYTMSHSKKTESASESSVPVAAAPQTGAPVAMPVQQQSFAPAQFGSPRNMVGTTASAAMPMQPMAAAPMGMPAQQQSMAMQPNPYAMAGYPPMQHQRPDVTIMAPREYRHAIGTPPAMPGVPPQRFRTVVSR